MFVSGQPVRTLIEPLPKRNDNSGRDSAGARRNNICECKQIRAAELFGSTAQMKRQNASA
jgi:hypothetical protein